MKKQNNVQIAIILLISLILTGTIGYSLLIDNLSIIDALYMTVITISTVGFEEVGFMDAEAKLFSIFLIFVSLGSVSYLFTSIISSFLEGDLRSVWRRRKMESQMANLKNHYIICGAGETGANAIKQFEISRAPFVVIDKDEVHIKDLTERNIFSIHGDATQEYILDKAGIKEAKGLIASLSKDSDNVYTVLTARQMNKNLYIVSRAINKGADSKLKKAGANNTISPNEIGGARMASLMLRPNVISFLDVITHAGDLVLDLEDVVILKNSSLIDKTLKEAKIPQKTGLIILAIKKHGLESLSLNPSSDEKLEENDTMIVLGTEIQVNELKKIANDTGERHIIV